MQQRQGPVAGTPTGDGIAISDPSDRFEPAAEANAERAMANRIADDGRRGKRRRRGAGMALQSGRGRRTSEDYEEEAAEYQEEAAEYQEEAAEATSEGAEAEAEELEEERARKKRRASGSLRTRRRKLAAQFEPATCSFGCRVSGVEFLAGPLTDAATRAGPGGGTRSGGQRERPGTSAQVALDLRGELLPPVGRHPTPPQRGGGRPAPGCPSRSGRLPIGVQVPAARHVHLWGCRPRRPGTRRRADSVDAATETPKPSPSCGTAAHELGILG